MATFEEVEIQRASDTERRHIICLVGQGDMDYVDIGTNRIPAPERVKNGLVLHLSHWKGYEGAFLSRIHPIRTHRGDRAGAYVLIEAGDLRHIDPGVQKMEKTTTRLEGEIVFRFTAKKGTEGI